MIHLPIRDRIYKLFGDTLNEDRSQLCLVDSPLVAGKIDKYIINIEPSVLLLDGRFRGQYIIENPNNQ